MSDVSPWNSPALALVTTERLRQITEEGFSPAHDARHTHGELLRAAECYLQAAAHDPERKLHPVGKPPGLWPWAPADWKPDADPMTTLVKGAALAVAEIDRRVAKRAGG